ncbi:hypothetical protein ACLK2C_12290 [Escherichia coli]
MMALCQQAMATGLPIMITGTNTWQTAVSLQNFNVDIPEDDRAADRTGAGLCGWPHRQALDRVADCQL